MSATVLSVAFPFAKVGAQAVGGAEQILSSLDVELVVRGYRSVVLARQGCVAAGQVLGTDVPPGVFTPELQELVTQAHRANLDRVLASGTIDLVHMHGIDFFKYPSPLTSPCWSPSTFRHPGTPTRSGSSPPTTGCSASQRHNADHVRRPYRTASWSFKTASLCRARRDSQPSATFALMLSRICPEKNLHEGIDAARAASMPVLLGGEVFPQ